MCFCVVVRPFADPRAFLHSQTTVEVTKFLRDTIKTEVPLVDAAAMPLMRQPPSSYPLMGSPEVNEALKHTSIGGVADLIDTNEVHPRALSISPAASAVHGLSPMTDDNGDASSHTSSNSPSVARPGKRAMYRAPASRSMGMGAPSAVGRRSGGATTQKQQRAKNTKSTASRRSGATTGRKRKGRSSSAMNAALANLAPKLQLPTPQKPEKDWTEEEKKQFKRQQR